MPKERQEGLRREGGQDGGYQAEQLSDRVTLLRETEGLTDQKREEFSRTLEGELGGIAEFSELEDGEGAMDPEFGGSIIVDMAGIDNLIREVSAEEQRFDIREALEQLVEAGVISKSDGRMLHLGPSGGEVGVGDNDMGLDPESHPAEVLELRELEVTSEGELEITDRTMVGFTVDDKEGDSSARAANLYDQDDRMILTNGFLVREEEGSQDNEQEEGESRDGMIAREIEFREDSDINLIELIKQAADEAGIEDYTARISVEGSAEVTQSVIQDLPEDESLDTMDQVGEVLEAEEVTMEEGDKLTGQASRSAGSPRKSEKWGQTTGKTDIYANIGHYHGTMMRRHDDKLDEHSTAHLQSITPKEGCTVKIVFEQADKTLQVERPEEG